MPDVVGAAGRPLRRHPEAIIDMNYRHEFHAGNHSEVFKHVLLCLLIERFAQKSKSFFVLDTHSGAGLFDLGSKEAQRTREAEGGIGKVYAVRSRILKSYLDIVESFNPDGLSHYPGSPSIVRSLLRDVDRLVACEAERSAYSRLKTLMSGDVRVSVHQRDGYDAIKAFVPPRERRGLVFLDPPFEDSREFEAAAAAIDKGLEKWPTGTFLLWYPVKGRSSIRTFRKALRNQAPAFCCEFLAYAKRPELLAGSGIAVFNPPWRFDNDARAVGAALAPIFDSSGSSFSMEWWTRAP